MRLTEREAKAEFSKAGIAVPRGVSVRSLEEVDGAVQAIGLPCVIKAQVLTGGRGKAGLVRIVRDRDAALAESSRILSREGVEELLIEAAVPAASEIYAGITYDPVSARAIMLASASGGMEIEEVSRTNPEAIMKVSVDIASGLKPYQARQIAYGMGLAGTAAKSVADILGKLWNVFRAMDAELAEINPLFLLDDGSALAGDGKLIIDDNSAFRHPDYPIESRPYQSETARLATMEGIPYLQFDGDISLMCAGAGLTTTVYDLVLDAGGTVANYLEFGGPNYRKAVRAMELCLANDPVVVLIVTFGTIARADVMAKGIAEAVGKLSPTCPIVTCIRGTGEEEAWKILSEIGLEPLSDTEEAVRKAVALCEGRRDRA